MTNTNYYFLGLKVKILAVKYESGEISGKERLRIAASKESTLDS